MAYNATKASNKEICHSLDISPYEVDWKGWHFHFSTDKHADKFCDKMLEHKAWLDDSFSRRFHVDFDSSMLAAISLYQRIEGRGFYMHDDSGHVYRDGKDILLTVVM